MKARGKITREKVSKVRSAVESLPWFEFGNEDLDCEGFGKYRDLYLGNNRLPHPCNKCYKILVFWDGSSRENMSNFLEMIESFRFNYTGKLNYEVIVFYFRGKRRLLRFLDYLQKEMRKFDVQGRIEWRRACKEFQVLKPELWKNDKEFIASNPR